MSIWPVYVLVAATLFSRPACTRNARSARPASVLRRSLVRKPGRKHGPDGPLAATTRGNVPSVTGLPVAAAGAVGLIAARISAANGLDRIFGSEGSPGKKHRAEKERTGGDV